MTEKVSYLFGEPEKQKKTREERRIYKKERTGGKSEVNIKTIFSDEIFPDRKINLREPETEETEILYEKISSVFELAVDLSLNSDGYGVFFIKDESFGNKNKESGYFFMAGEEKIETSESNPKIDFRTINAMGKNSITIAPRRERSGIKSIEITFTLP